MNGAGLSPDQLDLLAPFRLELDGAGHIVGVGPALAERLPESAIGAPLSEWFETPPPHVEHLGVEMLRRSTESGLYIRVRGEPLALRGQVLASDERFHLILRPWVNDTTELSRMGVRLSELPAADPAFDQFLMVQTLRASMADLERLTDKLNRQAQRLRDARDAALSASRAKDRFLAFISHELRTPMTGIIGLLELAGDKVADGPAAEDLRQALACADSLRTLLNDLLDVSRIASGQLRLEQRRFNLLELLNGTVGLFNAGSHVPVRAELASDLPAWVMGDSYRLRQILMNLLGNARKFTSNGEIVLRARRGSGEPGDPMIAFSVSDTGIGIPAARLPHIFERFNEAADSTTRQFGGAGLGLSICRDLVAMMSGSLEVDSVEGRGSTFSFAVRLPGVDAPAITREMRAPVKTLSGHVLLAEDNPVNQMVAKRLLNSLGLDVTVVSNGREAVERFDPDTFVAAILDVHMPEMDGLQAARAIRKRWNGPILAYSAGAHESDIARCRDAGMNFVIPKPVVKAELARILAQALAPRLRAAS